MVVSAGSLAWGCVAGGAPAVELASLSVPDAGLVKTTYRPLSAVTNPAMAVISPGSVSHQLLPRVVSSAILMHRSASVDPCSTLSKIPRSHNGQR